MTQEELATFQALLSKARQALPSAESFWVEATVDGFQLTGQGSSISTGRIYCYRLNGDNEIEVGSTDIY